MTVLLISGFDVPEAYTCSPDWLTSQSIRIS